MATQLQKCDDDDDDLEALRRAALQTLGCNKPATNSSDNLTNTLYQPQQISSLGKGVRVGVSYTQPGRNQIFQRHRLNSNLIAIVPISNDPPPGNDNAQSQSVGRGRAATVATSTSPKLGLPQHRYCKVESDQENKLDGPIVSTKFSRYDDSNSDSSADESEDDNETSDKVSVGSGVAAELDNDPDVLMMADDEEEDSLEKLMDELEEEMNKSDSNVLMNSNVKSEPKKHKKPVTSKSKRNICDISKSQKSQGGLSTSKVVPGVSSCGNQKTKEPSHNSSLEYTEDTTIPVARSHVSSSCISNNHKDNFLSERTRSDKPSSMHQNSHLSPTAVGTSQKQLSPVFSRKSRSRSRTPNSYSTSLLKSRHSGSQSPRSRFSYSPVRNRIPRSPRHRMSRSPVYLARSRSRCRSRSRSPVRSVRSPRKRYSRSPPSWHQPGSNKASKVSPLRQSPRPRRPLSPRQSPSRLNCISLYRSPESRWWASPRRSRSPQSRRTSHSPLPKRLTSPRTRRISVSPRRPISPLRRRLSPSPPRRNPSPPRRNPSPPRRFSPPRRNPSPPRGRYSHSLSRSPERFMSRGRSPSGSGLFHHGSPVSPKRRVSRSPSLRRRLSHSPYNRLPPRHVSAGRKLSPWSPSRQPVNQRALTSSAARRYSDSPSGKQRSPSPYGSHRRQSNSPNRKPCVSRLPPRTQESPVRDLRRPLQEPRMNNIRPRSRSPLLQPHLHRDPNVHHNHSPIHLRSPCRRSESHTSSISLSPSPERGTVNNIHRYKSPLRLRVADYANPTAPVLHSAREGSGGRQRNLPSPIPGPSKKPSKIRSSKRKEPKTKAQKREKSKEDTRKDLDRRSKEDLQNTAGERIPVLDSSALKDCVEPSDIVGVGSNLARMEARRRKFESTGPIKPDGKKICLKTTQHLHEQQDRGVTDQDVQKHTFEEKDQEMVIAVAVSDGPAVLEAGEDFDEPYLELQTGDLWSSEESDSDNEARFKSSASVELSGSEKVGGVPFTRLLGQTKTSVHKEERLSTKPKQSSFSSRKSSAANVNDGAEGKKGLEDLRSQAGESQPETKKSAGKQQQFKNKLGDVVEFEDTDKLNAVSFEVGLKLKHSANEGSNDVVEEIAAKSREGDLRAELSRRRAERLTKGTLYLSERLTYTCVIGVAPLVLMCNHLKPKVTFELNHVCKSLGL
ncbi:hypothetical protein Cfor_03623 [Coptotermes formosanus]|uniref:Uncharacterized protein n=1 Tax=Coptotermes formosanus TaxID=36987 RepID=A0A6L2PDR7_COPFO|nr:hypothetical protein Cfor_03623 [Coptotermes formosanus]